MAKPWIWLLGAAGIALYLVVVDLGVSAGRIHHGVEISGVDLGGLTESEAAVLLTAHAEKMRLAPVVFFGPGIRESLTPRDVRWKPQPENTARAAMGIGRDGAPFGALADRVQGWLRGITLDWVGHAAPRKVTRFIDEIEARLAEEGLSVDRARFRFKIKRALRSWPRQALRIPVSEG